MRPVPESWTPDDFWSFVWAIPQPGYRMFRSSLSVILLALLAGCSAKDREVSQATPLTAADSRAIRSVDSAYVAAWLRDDTAGVLATLAPDAILMPAGQHPLVGASEIRAFWWPQDGSHTKILTFVRQLDELDGRGDVAWTRGTDTLTFTYAKGRSEEHTSEFQSPYVISYAVFCLKKKNQQNAVGTRAIPVGDGLARARS